LSYRSMCRPGLEPGIVSLDRHKITLYLSMAIGA
jgi:hypothetical protein